MSNKKYFHELTEEERESITDWKAVLETYKQPSWCAYPGALDGFMGCWSLVGGYVHGENFCKGCDCHETVYNFEIEHRTVPEQVDAALNIIRSKEKSLWTNEDLIIHQVLSNVQSYIRIE